MHQANFWSIKPHFTAMQHLANLVLLQGHALLVIYIVVRENESKSFARESKTQKTLFPYIQGVQKSLNGFARLYLRNPLDYSARNLKQTAAAAAD
jgi:uncharacterized membrane protein